MKRKTGYLEVVSTASEPFKAFTPYPLPPEPPLNFRNDLLKALENTNRALGRLDGLPTFFPDISLFLYFYVRKEALLSSQIEGTQSSFSDLLLYEMKVSPGVPIKDVEEVSSYVAALNYGIEGLKEFPICSRLLRNIHGVLLSKGRGQRRAPGIYRTSQVWIGGSAPGDAVFIPPPSHKVEDCIASLENFINSDSVPTLIKAALAHVQFETIHPFLDGNGRLGRLLITLILFAEKALSQPLLYLSLFFKKNRSAYYDWLQRVRSEGDWEGWLRFFLSGVHETAEQAVLTAKKINDLFELDREMIRNRGEGLANSMLAIHDFLMKNPMTNAGNIASGLANISRPTVYKALRVLEAIGIIEETTGRVRGKIFLYKSYFDLLKEGV